MNLRVRIVTAGAFSAWKGRNERQDVIQSATLQAGPILTIFSCNCPATNAKSQLISEWKMVEISIFPAT